MTTEINPLAKMREPFPANQISKLPKETKAQIDKRKADSNFMVFNCKVCGGHHHKDANHLDYVGHAALTDRMLDADIAWTWEPVAFGPDGLPALDRNGGLWIRLTVGGITRMGYGDADGKTGGNAVKEAIGDALRNAAMRFGAALDLWHKGDLHLEDEPEAEKAATIDWTQRGILIDLAKAAGMNILTVCEKSKIERIDDLPADKFEAVKKWLGEKIDQLNIDNAQKEAA